jgi:hypothetical protein
MRLITRVSCIDVSLYWIVSFPFKLMMLANPAVYWWTGTSVIAASNADIACWLLPSVLGSVMFVAFYSRNLIIPVMSDITQLLSAVVVLGNVTLGLLRPRGQRFKVTPKGVSRDRVVVQWALMWPFLLIAAATIGGLALNASAHSPLVGGDGYGMNVFWSLFNVGLVGLVCLACIELPRRRTDERFVSNEPGAVIWPDRSASVRCVIPSSATSPSAAPALARLATWPIRPDGGATMSRFAVRRSRSAPSTWTHRPWRGRLGVKGARVTSPPQINFQCFQILEEEVHNEPPEFADFRASGRIEAGRHPGPVGAFRHRRPHLHRGRHGLD